jgi:8-oxo-dGTP diphosphatase
MSYTYEWPRPALTVDAVVFRRKEKKVEVLLIRRKHYPFEGMWALPGGFMDMDETCEEAVYRELEEETHLTGVKLQQLHTFGKPGRDPRGRTVSVVFWGVAPVDNSAVEAGDDAAFAEWIDVNFLPEIAFDHAIPIQMALKRLNQLA